MNILHVFSHFGDEKARFHSNVSLNKVEIGTGSRRRSEGFSADLTFGEYHHSTTVEEVGTISEIAIEIHIAFDELQHLLYYRPADIESIIQKAVRKLKEKKENNA